VVGLAHALGARALADGLPTVDDLSVFAALGCDALQGDAIAGSMPADEVLAWLAKHQEAAKVVEFQRD
jgi:EAL domain-containing protein (putative c-di-GMP-specific phosphodiesterase class I)